MMYHGVGLLGDVAVVELGGMGAAPSAGMMLADLGAHVTRIDRPDQRPGHRHMYRRSQHLQLDLKSEKGRLALLDLLTTAHVMIESFRPGVAEALGIGPAALTERHPGLVYARLSGWGRTGPRAAPAGHDLLYAAAAGAVYPVGHADRPPVPPLAYVGDIAGGATFACGIVAAVTHARATGAGCVLDTSLLELSAYATTPFRGLLAEGRWSEERQSNLLDGGAPFYSVYQTSDERFLAVGALEPKFYRAFLDGLGVEERKLADWPQDQPERWPELRARVAAIVARQPLSWWEKRFASLDACVSPVRKLTEAAADPQVEALDLVLATGEVRPPWHVEPTPVPRVEAR